MFSGRKWDAPGRPGPVPASDIVGEESVPLPSAERALPKEEVRPLEAGPLLGDQLEPLLLETAGRVNAFLLGMRMGRTTDGDVMTAVREFCETLARLRYLASKIERAVSSR